MLRVSARDVQLARDGGSRLDASEAPADEEEVKVKQRVGNERGGRDAEHLGEGLLGNHFVRATVTAMRRNPTTSAATLDFETEGDSSK